MAIPFKQKLPPIRKGITFIQSVALTDELSEPVDLSDYEVRMQIRPDYNETPIADLSTVSGEITTEDNRILVIISATATKLLTAGSYKYDIEIESSGGLVYQVMYGSVAVKESVTVED